MGTQGTLAIVTVIFRAQKLWFNVGHMCINPNEGLGQETAMSGKKKVFPEFLFSSSGLDSGIALNFALTCTKL